MGIDKFSIYICELNLCTYLQWNKMEIKLISRDENDPTINFNVININIKKINYSCLYLSITHDENVVFCLL